MIDIELISRPSAHTIVRHAQYMVKSCLVGDFLGFVLNDYKVSNRTYILQLWLAEHEGRLPQFLQTKIDASIVEQKSKIIFNILELAGKVDSVDHFLEDLDFFTNSNRDKIVYTNAVISYTIALSTIFAVKNYTPTQGQFELIYSMLSKTNSSSKSSISLNKNVFLSMLSYGVNALQHGYLGLSDIEQLIGEPKLVEQVTNFIHPTIFYKRYEEENSYIEHLFNLMLMYQVHYDRAKLYGQRPRTSLVNLCGLNKVSLPDLLSMYSFVVLSSEHESPLFYKGLLETVGKKVKIDRAVSNLAIGSKWS